MVLRLGFSMFALPNYGNLKLVKYGYFEWTYHNGKMFYQIWIQLATFDYFNYKVRTVGSIINSVKLVFGRQINAHGRSFGLKTKRTPTLGVLLGGRSFGKLRYAYLTTIPILFIGIFMR